MGSGYNLKCPKCGYRFHSSNGVGFMFPRVYAETVEKAKAGELGPQILDFFRDHEDGAIDIDSVTLCCEECGHLDGGMNLTMYVPNGKKPDRIKHGRWSVAMPFEKADYVTDSDLEEYYTEYAKYSHKCEKCGRSMRVVENIEDMLCPECRVPLEIEDIIMWD